MADPREELVGVWMQAARDDLGSAVKLIEGDSIYPGTSLYHCQQCAEKALKAFLLSIGVAFEKTHNLSVLVELCSDKDSAFQQLKDLAERLTPYATLYRYPEEVETPTIDEAREAIIMARAVLDVVAAVLSH